MPIIRGPIAKPPSETSFKSPPHGVHAEKGLAHEECFPRFSPLISLSMIIGLTGNIASGKSVVAEILRSLHIPILDADEIAHQILYTDREVVRAIRRRWGDSAFLPDGTINRKALASTIFSSPEDRQYLEKLFHPKIKREILRVIQECRRKKEPLVVVAPLLFEARFTKPFDEIWLTVAPYPIRLQRVRHRDGLSYREAKRRMKSQMPQRAKAQKSKVIISTHKPLKELRTEVQRLLSLARVRY